MVKNTLHPLKNARQKEAPNVRSLKLYSNEATNAMSELSNAHIKALVAIEDAAEKEQLQTEYTALMDEVYSELELVLELELAGDLSMLPVLSHSARGRTWPRQGCRRLRMA